MIKFSHTCSNWFEQILICPFAEFRVRRALKKQRGGDISVPVPRTNEQIRADIKQRIGGK